MSSININELIKKKQIKYLAWGLSLTSAAVISVFVLLYSPNDDSAKTNDVNATNMAGGPIDESFTESNAESAISTIQMESKDTLKSVSDLTSKLKELESSHEKKIDDLRQLIQEEFKKQKEASNEQSSKGQNIQNAELWHTNTYQEAQPYKQPVLLPLENHHIEVEQASWRYDDKRAAKKFKKTTDNYVPAGSYANAIVLLGADADASVNGETRSQPMTFKIMSDAHLPNNKRTKLKGCFLTGNTYGDVSSERSYARAHTISCSFPGKPMIEKEINAWIAFRGKSGIKGKVAMRDGKILTWAGISGALSGFASVAQASQSVQSISPLGSTSTIPSNKVFGAGAYAGAANSMDRLSQYYIKRADQYHPIVQVGAGNMVEIVFEKGFFLYGDEDKPLKGKKKKSKQAQNMQAIDPTYFDPNTQQMTQNLLDEMDRTNKLSLGQSITKNAGR